MEHIADVFDPDKIDKTKFNLIAAGCGTGKSFFACNSLLRKYPDVQPNEVIFVTSRSLAVEQQSKYEQVVKFTPSDSIIKVWNNDDNLEMSLAQSGIRIMTYDKIIGLITEHNSVDSKCLQNVKIVIFDECHVMLSDKFINDMYSLRVWIKLVLDEGSKMIIGMSATPGILKYYADKGWGIKINQVNKKVLMRHKAKQMICTNFDTIPYLVTSGKLEGKTLIMCVSVKDCETLQKSIPNSAILVSKNNARDNKEMRQIRDHISEHEAFPDYTCDEAGNKCELLVLIATTTAREGYNLCEASGVRNIVCCFGDSLHITQIAGRARYDLDNLVVAQTPTWQNNLLTEEYLKKERLSFSEFMNNTKNAEWFARVQHLVQHDVYKVKRFRLSSDEASFINYINEKWLVPPNASKKEARNYRIYKQEDKDEIVAKFARCKIVDERYRPITFHFVIDVLKGCLGYEVLTNVAKINKKCKTYKLIVSFDEEKITYKKAVEPYEECQ